LLGFLLDLGLGLNLAVNLLKFSLRNSCRGTSPALSRLNLHQSDLTFLVSFSVALDEPLCG